MSISRCFPSTQCFTLESSHVYIKPLKIIHYYSLDCSDTLWVWILDVVVKLCIFANGILVQMNCILITYLNQQSRTTTVNWFAKRFSISNSEPISYYYYFEIFYDNFKSWTWKPCDEMKKKKSIKMCLRNRCRKYRCSDVKKRSFAWMLILHHPVYYVQTQGNLIHAFKCKLLSAVLGKGSTFFPSTELSCYLTQMLVIKTYSASEKSTNSIWNAIAYL